MNNTNLPPILHRFRDMADHWSNLATGGRFTLMPSSGVTPYEYRINFTSPETRMIVLPDPEDRTVVSSFVSTKHRNVTDRRTDSQPVAITARLHCKQRGRAVKCSHKNLWQLYIFIRNECRKVYRQKYRNKKENNKKTSTYTSTHFDSA